MISQSVGQTAGASQWLTTGYTCLASPTFCLEEGSDAAAAASSSAAMAAAAAFILLFLLRAKMYQAESTKKSSECAVVGVAQGEQLDGGNERSPRLLASGGAERV